jgi:hypothetical protein
MPIAVADGFLRTHGGSARVDPAGRKEGVAEREAPRATMPITGPGSKTLTRIQHHCRSFPLFAADCIEGAVTICWPVPRHLRTRRPSYPKFRIVR